jgi:hypothetical protein
VRGAGAAAAAAAAQYMLRCLHAASTSRGVYAGASAKLDATIRDTVQPPGIHASVVWDPNYIA